MMMWVVIFLVMGITSLLGVIYLISRFRKLLPGTYVQQHKFLSWISAMVPVLAIALIFYKVLNITTMMVVLLHMILLWLLCDSISWIVKKVSKKAFRYLYTGVAALVITALYLGMGWYFGHHIYETHYELTTAKDLGHESIRVVAIADSHLGITIDGEKFAEQMERIQTTNPDIVVVVGDFVDDDSEREDMLRACQALGELETTYGVYFVYGNHDQGYYNYRNFSAQEMRVALAENNVVVLEDVPVLIDDSFYLIGRRDRSTRDRQETVDLVSDLDPSKYMIVLDHQPNDYAGEAAADVDMVLSGHTHGGHIFPAGLIGLAIGANDNVYGLDHRENTDFIVTSGLSGWAIPFKTGTISEYVVVDIVGSEK